MALAKLLLDDLARDRIGINFSALAVFRLAIEFIAAAADLERLDGLLLRYSSHIFPAVDLVARYNKERDDLTKSAETGF